MGVSCILLWDPPEGLNPGQAFEFLQKRLEILGGRSQGAWSVDCEAFQSVPNLGQKVVYLLHSSEYTRSSFLLVDSGTCVVAENTLDTIFGHLKPFYAPRTQLKTEAKGQLYTVKEKYAVKFGAISVGGGSRGIVVEVEDKQCSRVSQCWTDLTTFAKALLYSAQPIDVPSFARQSDRSYTPADAMNQYTYIFTQLRRAPQPAPAAPVK